MKKLFQKSVLLVFSLFMAVMAAATVISFSRRSGHTRIDMGKIEQLRSTKAEQAVGEKSITPPPPGPLLST